MTGPLDHRRLPAWLLLCVVLVLLTGCSTLRGWMGETPEQAQASNDGPAPVMGTQVGENAPAAPQRSTEEEAAARAALPRLVVQAPQPLKGLLEKFLDLPRAVALADATSVSQAEWSRLIAATPAQARSLVQTEGYFEAQAEITQELGTPWIVTLKVTPGAQARVGRLTLDIVGEMADLVEQGNREARQAREAVESAWPLKTGSPFRNEDWSSAKNEVLARLRAQGYAAAGWSGTAAEIDAQTQQVRLFVVADSGPLYRAGEVKVEGAAVHGPDQVRALAGFKPGDSLTEERLQSYQERLLKTGLYDQVTVLLDPTTDTAASAPVNVRVRESKLQALTTAVGISANNGPRVTLEHTHRRAFGWAATARNKFEWGRDLQSWDGELATHPDENFERNILGGTVERELTDTDLVLSQRLRLGRSRDTPAAETLRFVEGEHARECSRVGEATSGCVGLYALSLNQHMGWRRVDNLILPTKGYTLQLQGGVGVADGTESSKGGFLRLYGRAVGYWPVGDAWYTQARLELGSVWTQSGVEVPDSQRFRAGGDESVRGYDYRTLAPLKIDGSVTGGRMLFTTSFEIARPVSPKLPSVWWATFIDAGRAADSLKELDPALGYGVGVRWRSPVGPLRLDWAWGQELKQSRVHLSVGIAF